MDEGGNNLWVSPVLDGGERICTLECKVLFIPPERVPVTKGNPVVVVFFFSLFLLFFNEPPYLIAFCMSSLLFDCYLNGLSVCLVLVVDLL